VLKASARSASRPPEAEAAPAAPHAASECPRHATPMSFHERCAAQRAATAGAGIQRYSSRRAAAEARRLCAARRIPSSQRRTRHIRCSSERMYMRRRKKIRREPPALPFKQKADTG